MPIEGTAGRQGGAVRLCGVSKRFRRAEAGERTLRGLVAGAFGERRGREGVWALREVDLEVAPGECLGLVGGNGSGKSTLLRVVAGVLKPTSGRVEVSGKVASLIDLAAGLHPDLSGRENLELAALAAGMRSRELDAVRDDVIGFSGVEEFIDCEVRTYSTGMSMRLAFSLALHSGADLFLIDDVLGVGDGAFRRKALERLRELRRGGATILVVSHHLGELKSWCDRVAWLERGALADAGEPRRVLDAYALAGCGAGPRTAAPVAPTAAPLEIAAVRIAGHALGPDREFPIGSRCELELELDVRLRLPGAVAGIGIHGEDGSCCYAVNTGIDRVVLPETPGRYRLTLAIEPLVLLAGEYHVNANVQDGQGRQVAFRFSAASFRVGPETGELGVARLPHTWTVAPLPDGAGSAARQEETEAVPLAPGLEPQTSSGNRSREARNTATPAQRARTAAAEA